MELIDIGRIIFALIAVLGMIGLAALAARRIGFQNGAAAIHRTRRLSIVETLGLDQRRRAAILSCDGREHLIIFDQPSVTVIENGIPLREEPELFAAADAAGAPRKLHVPSAVTSLFMRQPRDHTSALRAAGVL
jgi:flagellar protein FliO/FliZ